MKIFTVILILLFPSLSCGPLPAGVQLYEPPHVLATEAVNAEPTPPPSAPSNAGGRQPRFTLVATGQEARNYDFASARPEGKRTTVIESIGHLIKSCLGGGVVSVHEAYKENGLWSSLVLNVFLGMLVTYLMLVLAKSAQKAYGRTHVAEMSYPDLAEASVDICPFPKLRKYSRCFRYCVDATIMLDLFGSCCAYQVIISNTMIQIMDEYIPGGSPLNSRAAIAALYIPCLAICMILTLKYLAPFSLVADFVILVVAIATVVYGVRAATVSPTDMPAFKGIVGLLSFTGVCVFSMEGVGVTLPVENHMKDPSKIGVVLWSGMSFVMVVVMTVGFFGYYGFGEKAKAPVTSNFPFDAVTIVLKISIGVMIYITFALNFWVPFNLAWVYLKKRHAPEKYDFWERIYRAGIVTVITLIAIAFPDVAKLISVIGVFCLSNMGFIYPATIELLLDWDDPGLGVMKWRLIKFILIFIFGVAVMIPGTISNINELIKTVFKL